MTDPKETEVLERHKEDLQVQLHPEEVHDYAKRLAAIEGELAQLEDHIKSVKADLAAKKAKLTSERSNVALKVRTEKETRSVGVTMTAHFRTNRVISTRDDTHEVIAERALSAGERQAAMKFDAAKGVALDLLASATEKPQPVITTPPCGAVALGGICTVHGSDCPNPETLGEREAKFKDREDLKGGDSDE